MSPIQPPPALPSSYLGVDVAKASLAVAAPGQALTCPNTPRAHQRLVVLCRQFPAPHVVLEASGGYEQDLVRALQAAQIPVSVVQPQRVRHFAKAAGVWSKTDPVDAAVLRRFGEVHQPAPTLPRTPTQEALAELIGRRRQLVELQTQEANRAEHHAHKVVQRTARHLLSALKKEIQACETAITKLLATDAGLAQRVRRLQELYGMGPVNAVTLVVEMPELGQLSDQTAAALAGVAPYPQESGQWKGRRRIRGGRPTVRLALYTAAMTARRHDPILKAYYERLIARGKAGLVAITAVMRKLIILCNRLLKDPSFVLKTSLA
jgi:transposase